MSDMSTTDLKITNPYSDLKGDEKPFKSVVTLDPNLTVDAWRRLNRSTWASEVALWPVIFHGAIVRGIKTSKILARR